MPTSNTPRTDSAIISFEYEMSMLGGEMGGGTKEFIEPNFARQLETENADLLSALSELFYTQETHNEAQSWYEGSCEDDPHYFTKQKRRNDTFAKLEKARTRAVHLISKAASQVSPPTPRP